MNNEQTAVDAQVVEAPVVPSSLDTIKAQRVDFVAQLEQVKKNMAQYQQAFETERLRGVKLEGAIESLDILSKSLSK